MKNTNVLKRNNGDQPLSFSNVIDDIFQNNLRHFFDESPWGTEGSPRSGVPVNIRETEENYELDVVAPGCKKEGFKIDIEGNLLTVSYNDNQEQNSSGQRWMRNEFVHLSFNRSFTLYETVDVNNINATYTDGILRLSMAKNEKAKIQARTIEVK